MAEASSTSSSDAGPILCDDQFRYSNEDTQIGAVLGISAYYHDSAACLIRDGVIVAAAQEERFSRIKGDKRFPSAAAAFCLAEAGLKANELSAVAFYEKPILKFDRLLETYLWLAPKGLRSFLNALPLWSHDRLRLDEAIRVGLGGYEGRVLWCEHHESHAASAFYPSPFDDAAILTVDGVGEWATATIGSGHGSRIALTHELQFPDSLGLLYSAFTFHLGFRVNSGEYKVMGLAPFGEPRYVEAIYKHVLHARSDGSFTLNQAYFDYMGGLAMTNRAFSNLFGGPPRKPEAPITQREMDLARSVQQVTEDVVVRMATAAVLDAGSDSLCLAGGVALNAVANGRLVREGVAKRVWVQPAAGDSGGAIGAAFLAWYRYFASDRVPNRDDDMRGTLLGPAFDDCTIAESLATMGATCADLGRDGVIARTAELLAEGAVIGWFDGRMEFGPRALGARSILADPRGPDTRAKINLKVKFREEFRPFAPAVLAERASEYFEFERESPYMLMVAQVRKERTLPVPDHDSQSNGFDRLTIVRSDIPAVTHVDGSARLQTVTSERSPGLYAVLKAFESLTGCAVLVNTSFNVRGEPIVCSPSDAYQCFMRSNLDYLAMPPFLLDKARQSNHDPGRWNRRLPID